MGKRGNLKELPGDNMEAPTQITWKGVVPRE